MDRVYRLHGFDFNQKAAVHQDVESVLCFLCSLLFKLRFFEQEETERAEMGDSIRRIRAWENQAGYAFS